MKKIISSVGAALLATLALSGCEKREIDPVTRAAIFGCIEIAEKDRLDNVSRALMLEKAGCGRLLKADINVVMKEYREEQALIAAEAEAESTRRRQRCGKSQAQLYESERSVEDSSDPKEQRESTSPYATMVARRSCEGLSQEQIAEAVAEFNATRGADSATLN